MSLSLSLPLPPSINHYWRRVGVKTIISREGRAFREQVCNLLAARQIKPVDGRLVVVIEVFPPDKRERDLDNFLKALLDALQHSGAYANDSKIDDLRIIRREVVPLGKVHVSIKGV